MRIGALQNAALKIASFGSKALMTGAFGQGISTAEQTPNFAASRIALHDLEKLRQIAVAALKAAPLPPVVVALVTSLPVADSPAVPQERVALPDELFKAELLAVMPLLRAYGRSLSGSADVADDLLQETLVKAWAARQRFIAGTNMRAWTHVILRNAFYTRVRRLRFRGEYDPVAADHILAVQPTQDSHIALIDLQRALMQLPVEQREVLVMMGAGGMSCEEVAAICQCATGTVKSRAARGRSSLRLLLANGQLKQHRADAPATSVSVFDQLMQSAAELGSRKAIARPKI
jgi:RNA polymerase sigma-70 factor (ECF subfamily)